MLLRNIVQLRCVKARLSLSGLTIIVRCRENTADKAKKNDHREDDYVLQREMFVVGLGLGSR